MAFIKSAHVKVAPENQVTYLVLCLGRILIPFLLVVFEIVFGFTCCLDCRGDLGRGGPIWGHGGRQAHASWAGPDPPPDDCALHWTLIAYVAQQATCE